MKFCTSCGAPLEFFEFLDGDLCSSCLTREKENPPAETPGSAGKSAPELEELSHTTLCVEDGRIVLKSPEGWVLWSGPANEPQQLQTVLDRAHRILKIRNKRKK